MSDEEMQAVGKQGQIGRHSEQQFCKFGDGERERDRERERERGRGRATRGAGSLARAQPKICISRESNPGHIDGNDVFYH